MAVLNRLRSWWRCRSGRHLEPLIANRDSVMQWSECLLCGEQFNRAPLYSKEASA